MMRRVLALAVSALGALCLPACTEDTPSGLTRDSGVDAAPASGVDDGGSDGAPTQAPDAACNEFECAGQQVCCRGDEVVYFSCCEAEEYCPAEYSDECTMEQRCADSPLEKPDCWDSCGRSVAPICDSWNIHHEAWQCPPQSETDAGTDCPDAGSS